MDVSPKDHEESAPAHEAYLRREVRRGVEQLDRGEVGRFDAEKIIREERRLLCDKGPRYG
jgi:hypothetical protein